MEGPANIGKKAHLHDAQARDYSLPLHDAIAELASENQRLHNLIDDLRNRIECLRSGFEPHELGSA